MQAVFRNEDRLYPLRGGHLNPVNLQERGPLFVLKPFTKKPKQAVLAMSFTGTPRELFLGVGAFRVCSLRVFSFGTITTPARGRFCVVQTAISSIQALGFGIGRGRLSIRFELHPTP